MGHQQCIYYSVLSLLLCTTSVKHSSGSLLKTVLAVIVTKTTCSGEEVAKHNEVVGIKREIADMLNSLTMDVLEQEAKNEEVVVVENDVHTQAKRDANAAPQFAFQNCVGNC